MAIQRKQVCTLVSVIVIVRTVLHYNSVVGSGTVKSVNITSSQMYCEITGTFGHRKNTKHMQL